ncbi:MAG: fibronectin type III domain-containing protein, partial [Planctomycetota bacterium]
DVISQTPTGGTQVASGSSVDIEVSLGPAPVSVPNVVGQAQATAESNITGAGLVVGTVTTAYSAVVPVGDVISQSPVGSTSVAPGTSVDIEVSLGVQMVAVPDVVGQAQATAEANIVAANLVVGTVTTAYSSSVSAGDVISQSPVGSTSVASGTSVDIEVSLGAEPMVPAAPSGLSATAISKTEIDISWTDNASNETGFKIERSKRNNGSFVQIATVGANVTSFSDTGLKKNTTYYYRVRATNADGDSAYSNEASAKTPK